MFETLLDLVAAYLIAANIDRKPTGILLAMLAGALITITLGLGLAHVDLTAADTAWQRASADAILRGTLCAVSTAIFRLFLKPHAPRKEASADSDPKP